MTLLQLKYIVAIDQYGHFGKAAEACGLTQSTLSLMLKKLEEELDVRLFDRDTHPVSATAVGRKIIDQAKVVLYNVDQIAEMTRSEREMLSGPLKIALISRFRRSWCRDCSNSSGVSIRPFPCRRRRC